MQARREGSTSMKIVIAGAWQWPWYERACAGALVEMGHDVIPFAWNQVFTLPVLGKSEGEPQSRFLDMQRRVTVGPAISRLNSALVSLVAQCQPDVLLLYRAPLVLGRSLKRIRRQAPQTVIAQYCNDDPFSPQANPLTWRHLRRAIPLCDVHFVFRETNVAEFRAAGARRVHLLRAYYVPSLHFPLAVKERVTAWGSQVLFAGHYEDDWRVECLEKLLQEGVPVSLRGGGWQNARPSQVAALQRLLPTEPAIGADYRQAVCGAKIALGFLSSLNRDTYTSRNFEVPAMGTMMLSQYTDDLNRLFDEGVDIEFFRSPEELLSKARHYLDHEDERQTLARAGRARVVRDGHDVGSRMAEMVTALRDVPR
jgi:spore maturation protein CgeB